MTIGAVAGALAWVFLVAPILRAADLLDRHYPPSYRRPGAPPRSWASQFPHTPAPRRLR